MYTLRELLQATDFRNDGLSWQSAALGFAVHVLAQAPTTGALSLGDLLSRLLPTIAAGHFEVYFDAFGRYVGHVAWADGGSSATPVLNGSGGDPENERAVRIVQLLAPFGDIHGIIRELCHTHFRECDAVYYTRYRKRGNHYLKQLRWAPRRALATLAVRHPRASRSETDHLHRPGEIRHGVIVGVRQAIDLGLMLLLLRDSAWAHRYSLSQAIASIRPPLLLQQYCIFSGPSGAPDGAFTWGWFSSTTLTRRPPLPLHQLHPSEWNEGNDLCLCLCEFRPRAIAQLRSYVTRDWCPDETRILTYPCAADEHSQGVTAWSGLDRSALVEWLTRTAAMQTGVLDGRH